MSTVLVHAGDNLQTAINNAVGGDTLVLDNGATWTGSFQLPTHSGSSPVVIQPQTVPTPNVRVSPASAAGFPKIQPSAGGDPGLTTTPGCFGWSILGVEFLPTPGGANDIIRLGDGSEAQNQLSQVPYDLTIDRCYIHGTPLGGQKRGIALNSGNTAITNCYISDIFTVGQDSQAIGGWNGTGPHLIDNNYLEAAGENYLCGGNSVFINGVIPSNITFTNNYVAKNLGWRGKGYNVKNLLELKTGVNVTIDSNIFEYCWADAQVGIPIVITVRNEYGANPWVTIANVTFTNNIVRHAGGGINILSQDDRGASYPSVPLNNLVIQNNRFYDISESYGGSARFLQINNGGSGIHVTHNTCINTQSDGAVSVYFIGAPTTGFKFKNNIIKDNGLCIFGDQGQSLGTATLENQAPGYEYVDNVQIGTTFTGSYPATTSFPATIADVGFTDVAANNYYLTPSSPYHNQASDGLDIGIVQVTDVVVTGITGTGNIVAPVVTFDGSGKGKGTFTAQTPTFSGSGLVFSAGSFAASAPTMAGTGTVSIVSYGGFTAQAATFSGSGAGFAANAPITLDEDDPVAEGVNRQVTLTGTGFGDNPIVYLTSPTGETILGTVLRVTPTSITFQAVLGTGTYIVRVDNSNAIELYVLALHPKQWQLYRFDVKPRAEERA